MEAPPQKQILEIATGTTGTFLRSGYGLVPTTLGFELYPDDELDDFIAFRRQGKSRDIASGGLEFMQWLRIWQGLQSFACDMTTTLLRWADVLVPVAVKILIFRHGRSYED